MKKILSAILVLTLAVSLMPTASFAAATDTVFHKNFDDMTLNATWNKSSVPSFMGLASGNSVTGKYVSDTVDGNGKSMLISGSGSYTRTYFLPFADQTLNAGETYEMSANVKIKEFNSGDAEGKLRIGNFDV
ncbi:MAG: hypothetical protein E7403_05660, partial [Ruminococcaceae bacterium]|nr:hypothetical protein [Oscillospiraceae bacterium]